MHTMLANGFTLYDCACAPPVSYDVYGLGFTFWTWDLTPDQNASSQHLSDPVNGVIRLVMQYSIKSNEPIIAFVLCEYTKAYLIEGEERRVRI